MCTIVFNQGGGPAEWGELSFYGFQVGGLGCATCGG